MKALIVKLVKFYQLTVSPDKGIFVRRKNTCRFWPTCSEYLVEALDEYPWPKAIWLGARRILRCRPGGDWGYDPVPPLNKK